MKRKLEGKITSDKMDKTVVVEVSRLKKNAKYRKYYKVSRKIKRVSRKTFKKPRKYKKSVRRIRKKF